MGCYILNTNKSWDNQCDVDMVGNHTASAYGLPWGNNIQKLIIDDIVFLYRNHEGIVAYGIVDTNPQIKPFVHDNKTYNEYYAHLKNFRILKTPMSASKMKTITNRLSFRQTMFSINLDEAIQFIEEINRYHL